MFLDIPIQPGQHPLLEAHRARSGHNYTVVGCSATAKIAARAVRFNSLSYFSSGGVISTRGES